MKKKALLAALLAMTLLLSSCALVVKDPKVDAATVILKMGDKEITKAEVQEAVNNQLYDMAQYYAMFGSSLDTSDPEVIAQARTSAITALKQDMVLRAKAAELGFDQLTDEETAQMKEDAEAGWESAKSYVKSNYLSDEEKQLEGEELDQAILKKLEELGVSYEDYETSAARGEREYFSDDLARDYNSYYAQVADAADMGDQDAIDEMYGEFGEGDW